MAFESQGDIAINTEEKKRLAVKCARSHRSCSGCDWQHLCEDERRKRGLRQLAEYIAKMPEWKREYYGYSNRGN